MTRQLIAVVLGVVASAGTACGAEPDPIREKLEKAKADYEGEVDRLTKELTSALKQKEAASQKAGDLKAKEKAQAELKAFAENGELPKSVPTRSHLQAMETARKRMVDEYSAAVKAYTQAAKTDEAKTVDAEMTEFNKGSAAGTGAKRTAPDDRPPEVAKAREAFGEARKKHQADLMKGFDEAVDQLANKKLGVDERVRLVEVVKAEKDRFDKHGLIPFSHPMRAHLAGYQKNTSAADGQLKRAYDATIDRALRAKATDEVNKLRAELAATLDVKLVATWKHQPGTAPAGEMRLYSNGRINDPEGKATWSFKNGILTLRWPTQDPKARVGFWEDVCEVSADGSTYAGKNQLNVRITGYYVAK